MLLHELRVGLLSLYNPLPRGALCRSRGSIGDRLPQLLDLLGTCIHGGLNLRHVHLNIVEHTLLNRPAEEIQLPHRRLEHGLSCDLEHDPLAPAEGIEQLLAVCLQLGLVVSIDEELLVVQDIRDVMLLCIVCDEPIYETQRNLGSSIEEFHNLLAVVTGRIEPLEAAHDQLLLTLDLTLTCLWVWVYAHYREFTECINLGFIGLKS